MKTQILRKITHPYTIICQSMEITVCLGKIYQGFTKINPAVDYGKLSGDASVGRITIPL